MAASHPRAAFALAGRLGAMRNRITRRWPTAGEISALFPHLDAGGAASAAGRAGALYERNRVLVQAIARHGLDPFRPLVSASHSFQSMPAPRIVATFHAGAVHAFGPALERLHAPVLAFREGSIFTPRGALQIASTKGGEQARSAALHRALIHLRSGGFVFLALDVFQGEAIETRCLGRRLRLAPGAFALARWTSAPIQLAVARWTGHGVVIDAGECAATPEAASGWLERYLLERPGEITLGLLRNLLEAS
jgi:hypothetical protein